MKKLLLFIFLFAGPGSSKRIIAQDFLRDVKTYNFVDLKKALRLLNGAGSVPSPHIDITGAEQKAFVYVLKQLTQQGFVLSEDSIHQCGFEFKIYNANISAGPVQYTPFQFLGFDLYNQDSKNYKGWASIYVQRNQQNGRSKIYYTIFPRDTFNIGSAFINMQVKGIDINDMYAKISDSQLPLLFRSHSSFLTKIIKAVQQTCTEGCPLPSVVPACLPNDLSDIEENYSSKDSRYKKGLTTAASISILYNFFRDRECLYKKTALAVHYSSSIQ